MSLGLSQHWKKIQTNLFPRLEEELGPLSETHERLVTIIEFSNVCKVLKDPYYRGPGRPPSDRVALAHAFIAKALYNYTETKQLLEKLHSDSSLRRICGWCRKSQIPSESVFSRAFSGFAERGLANKIHDAFIRKYHGERLIEHVSRDATAIEARERIIQKENHSPLIVVKKRKRGRPRKGEKRPSPEPKKIQLQRNMTLKEMLVDLPNTCDAGCKKNAKGYKTSWKGYKLHVDTVDGDIPVSVLLTSASLHDSQADIPLAIMTEKKLTYLYELKDSAYDAIELRERSCEHGHVTLTDFNRRSPKDTRSFLPHEKERYKNRSSAERLNSNLKDNYGCRLIRMRGPKKMLAYLTFGIICIAVEQTIRLLI